VVGALDLDNEQESGSGFILSCRNKQAIPVARFVLCAPFVAAHWAQRFRDTTRPNKAQKGLTRLAETVECSLSLGAARHF